MHSYNIVNFLARSIPAPKIITHPTDLTAAASSSAVFKCSASACNKYSFEWKRTNSDLPKKSSLSNIGATSFLTIPDVTSDDVGEYYCVAWSNNKTSQSYAAKLQFSGTYKLHIIIIIIICIRTWLYVSYVFKITQILIGFDYYHWKTLARCLNIY